MPNVVAETATSHWKEPRRSFLRRMARWRPRRPLRAFRRTSTSSASSRATTGTRSSSPRKGTGGGSIIWRRFSRTVLHILGPFTLFYTGTHLAFWLLAVWSICSFASSSHFLCRLSYVASRWLSYTLLRIIITTLVPSSFTVESSTPDTTLTTARSLFKAPDTQKASACKSHSALYSDILLFRGKTKSTR